jgi:hypothetical protein
LVVTVQLSCIKNQGLEALMLLISPPTTFWIWLPILQHWIFLVGYTVHHRFRKHYILFYRMKMEVYTLIRKVLPSLLEYEPFTIIIIIICEGSNIGGWQTCFPSWLYQLLTLDML